VADIITLAMSRLCNMTCKVYVYKVDGKWFFDKKVFYGWWRDVFNEGPSETRMLPDCSGGKMPAGGRGTLLKPFLFDDTKDVWNFFFLNDEYFFILDQIVDTFNEMGVVVNSSLADECQGHGADRQAQSVYYNNNLNSVGVYDDKMFPYHANFVRRVLRLLKNKKLKNGRPGTNFEIGNELNGKGGVELAKIIIDELYKEKIEPWRITLGAMMIKCRFLGYIDPDTPGTWYDCKSKRTNMDEICTYLVKVYESEKLYMNSTHEVRWVAHSFGDYIEDKVRRPFGEIFHQVHDWWVKVKRIVGSVRCWLDTDGCDNADGYTGRPSAQRMYDMIIKLVGDCPKSAWLIGGFSKFTINFLPNGEKNFEMVLIARKMAEAVHKLTGKWPELRGKVKTYEEMYPEIEPPPPPRQHRLSRAAEPEVKPPINWRGEWNNNKGKIIAGAVILLGITILALTC